MSVTPFLQFFYGFAAYSSYLSCVAQALQAFHRCGNNVLRVVGTQALGTDVLDAGSLNYCTNSAAEEYINEEYKSFLTLPEDFSADNMEMIQNISAEAMEAHTKVWTEFRTACGQ